MPGETTIMTTIGDAPASPTEEAPAADAPAVDPAAPTDPAPPPAGPTAQEKLDLARRFDQAARREASSRKLAQETARAKQEAESLREQLSKAQKELAAELEAFRSDPVGYEIGKGRDPVDVVRRASSPETPEQKRIRILEESIASRDKAAEEAKAQAQRDAEIASQHQTMREFVLSINEVECPNLVTLHPDPQDVPRLVRELLAEETDDGQTVLEAFRGLHRRNPTGEEIKKALEHRASVRAKALHDDLSRIVNPPQVSDPNASQNGNRGPSLSNQHAGRVESGSSKPLTLEEKRARGKKILNAELEAETE